MLNGECCMLYNSCVVKYSKICRAYGAFDAELCTTSWAPVLTNSKFGRVFLLTYGIVHNIEPRNLRNSIIGRDYTSHTSSESLKSLDFKSN